jgi:hypothetical protein
MEICIFGYPWRRKISLSHQEFERLREVALGWWRQTKFINIDSLFETKENLCKNFVLGFSHLGQDGTK